MEKNLAYRTFLTLLCPCCCEVLKCPVVLHCSHIFCLDCAEMMIEMFKEANSEFCCPECHVQEPVFPMNKNWLIFDKKIEKILKHVKNINKNTILCALCNTQAEFCCSTCKIFICNECKVSHTTNKYKFHIVTDYKTYKKNYCFQHLMPKHFYSVSQHLLMCQACALNSRQKYDRSENILNMLESDISMIKSQYSNLRLFKTIIAQENPLKLLQYFSPLDHKLDSLQPTPDPDPNIYFVERSSETYYTFKGSNKHKSCSSQFSFPRWCSFTILLDNKILITGGKCDKDKGSTNTYFILEINKQVFKTGSMIMSHSSHPAILADDKKVYILGGKDADNVTNTHCETFNPENFEFNVIGSMHYGRTCAAAVSFNYYLFVFGGFVNGFTNLIEKYSISQDCWTDINNTLPVRLFQLGATVIDKASVLIFGGEISSDLKNLHSFVFSLKTEKFSLCRKMKVPDQFLSFWYHSVWTGKSVLSLKRNCFIEFDLEKTMWSKKKVKM